jgi:acetyl esterase/lipase
MTALAHDLVRRGIAAWNVEYRGTGRDGGGWPETLLDVGRAIDHLAAIEQVDRSRVVSCGHSAGGHLALWAAARTRLPLDSELPAPLVVPRAAVSLAGVCDLAAAARDGLGADAAQTLLGATPDEEPARYAQASPAALLPLAVPVLLVHGGNDSDVPVGQSRAFAGSAAAAGGRVELVELADADHFDVIDPAHAGWQAVVERLPALLGSAAGRPAAKLGAARENG